MDVHHVVVTRSDESSEMHRPPQIATRPADAMRANPGSFEFADEMVLPRQDIDTLCRHVIAVAGGRRNEQPLGSAWAETLDHPTARAPTMTLLRSTWRGAEDQRVGLFKIL